MSDERAKELEKKTKAELITDLIALEKFTDDLEHAKLTPAEPLVQWTVKMTAPGGDPSQPDFITLKYVNFDAALKEHSTNKAQLIALGYRELGTASRPPSTASATPSGGPLKGDEMYIAKYGLERLKDQRLKLMLYGTFDDGGLHQYPDIYFTSDEQEVWDALRGVNVDAAIHPTLPVEEECEWVATYKKGRPKKKGSGHYLDLIKLREA